MSSDHTILKRTLTGEKSPAYHSQARRVTEKRRSSSLDRRYHDIMVYARIEYNVFPSRIEVVEARDRYKERHPQINDNEESQRLSEPSSPCMTQVFSINKPMQSEQSVHRDVCRLSVNFGAYTVTLEGLSGQELEMVAQYIGAVLWDIQTIESSCTTV